MAVGMTFSKTDRGQRSGGSRHNEIDTLSYAFEVQRILLNGLLCGRGLRSTSAFS